MARLVTTVAKGWVQSSKHKKERWDSHPLLCPAWDIMSDYRDQLPSCRSRSFTHWLQLSFPTLCSPSAYALENNHSTHCSPNILLPHLEATAEATPLPRCSSSSSARLNPSSPLSQTQSPLRKFHVFHPLHSAALCRAHSYFYLLIKLQHNCKSLVPGRFFSIFFITPSPRVQFSIFQRKLIRPTALPMPPAFMSPA